MQIVLFSKYFPGPSVEDLGHKALELGYDGIDLAVRPGHPIHPGNAEESLPEAVRTWRDMGLVCPLVSAPMAMTDPTSYEVESIYAACAASGIPRLKIGLWKFNQGDDYWRLLDTARAGLQGFVDLGVKYGVQTCYQAHSGALIGSNCAGLMHLISGFDSKYVGAYPDIGHMALDGEDYQMGLSMVREYLSAVGIKDSAYLPQPEDRIPRYAPHWTKLGDGIIDWHRALEPLVAIGFDGPLTVHTEYDFDEAIMRQVGDADTGASNLEQYAKGDAAYLRQVLADLDSRRGG